MNISCSAQEQNKTDQAIKKAQNELFLLLEDKNLEDVSRYAIVNQIANNLITLKDEQGLILFLTSWVEEHPEDVYNAYWLWMTASTYLANNAEPIAEYYFDRILTFFYFRHHACPLGKIRSIT